MSSRDLVVKAMDLHPANLQRVKLLSASMKRFKVSLQVGVAFGDGVRESVCFVYFVVKLA